MTITALPSRNEYTATAGQTLFSYTFKIFDSTDLNVYVTPSGQDADDLTDIVTGYSVTGLGDEDGGTITLVVAASIGDLVTIVSDIPENRETDYQFNGDFIPQTVNADFDRVVSLTKQEADRSGRTLAFQESLQNATALTLPNPAALQFLRWKSDESGQENVDLAANGAPTTSDLVTYNQGAAGAVDRTVEERLQERVSIKDFGAVGDGSTDDLAAIESALNDNRTLYFPAGVYNLSDTLTITNERIRLVGDSTTSSRINLVSADLTKDAIVFTMTDPGIAFDYGDSNSIERLTISASSPSGDKTAGAALLLIKQNGFKLRDVTMLNHPSGLETAGAKDLSVKGLSVFGTNVAPSSASSLISVREHINTDSSIQVPFTNVFENITVGGTSDVAYGIHVTCCDGLRMSDMYIANIKEALVQIDNIPATTVVGDFRIVNTYFDGVSSSTGANRAIKVIADTDGSMVMLSLSNCTLANCKLHNMDLIGSKIQQVLINNCSLRQCEFQSILATDTTALKLNLTGSQIHNSSLNGTGDAIRILKGTAITITGNIISQDSVTSGLIPLLLTTGPLVTGTVTGNSIINFDEPIGHGVAFTKEYKEYGNVTNDTETLGAYMGQEVRIGSLTNDPAIYSFDGTPEGSVVAVPGSICLNKTIAGGEFAFYIKRVGVSNTGWEGQGTVLP